MVLIEERIDDNLKGKNQMQNEMVLVILTRTFFNISV